MAEAYQKTGCEVDACGLMRHHSIGRDRAAGRQEFERPLAKPAQTEPAKLAIATGWCRETNLSMGWIASRRHAVTRKSLSQRLQDRKRGARHG